MQLEKTNDINFTANQTSATWIARKGEQILAESDSERGAWRLLGVRGKKQKEMLENAGFEVRANK